jgi:beta-galactosidase GanA
VAKVLAAHEEFFSAAKPLPARAAILLSPETLNLHGLETWRKPNEDAMHSLIGCYQALHRAHVPVDFIYSKDLEEGAASRYQVLYLPYCYSLTAKGVAAIRRFVEEGGTVWADGMVGWKNENGETSMFPPGPLADVFGFTLEDIDAAWEPFPLSVEGEQAGESWRCVVQPAKAKALVRDSEGRITATENSYGKGRAIYYATALSLAVLRRRLPVAERWIAAPAVEASRGLPIRALEAPERMSFRALTTQKEATAVLNNWGHEGMATIAFPPAVRSVTDLVSGKSAACRTQAGVSTVEWRIERGGTAVLHARLS